MKQVKTNKEVLTVESSLQHIVQSILSNYQGMADAQNSFFVNQVPPTLCLTADKSVVSSLLSNLFSVIANYCKNTRIRISAKAYHDIIVMHIKDTSISDNHIMLSELQGIQTGADKIGGFLEVTSQRKKETTIAFSFINQPVQHHSY
ncbi:MAG: hypothetical protein ABUT20_50455 [Bacteroidota bacterium]